jgi:hypothetical protein
MMMPSVFRGEEELLRVSVEQTLLPGWFLFGPDAERELEVLFEIVWLLVRVEGVV